MAGELKDYSLSNLVGQLYGFLTQCRDESAMYRAASGKRPIKRKAIIRDFLYSLRRG